MTLIADTSYLLALFNYRDINRRAAAAFAPETKSEMMLLPNVALTEMAHFLVRDLGYVALRTVLKYLSDSEIELVPLGQERFGQNLRYRHRRCHRRFRHRTLLSSW